LYAAILVLGLGGSTGNIDLPESLMVVQDPAVTGLMTNMRRTIGNPLQNCDNGGLIQYDTVNSSLARSALLVVLSFMIEQHSMGIDRCCPSAQVL
jgi:hypothetical protein